MLGLEYIAAGYLHLASANIQCTMPRAPEITVSASGLQTKIIETKGIQELTMMSNAAGTETPYDKNAVVHTEGLRLGRIGLKGAYEFQTQTYPDLGKACFFVSKVNIKVELDPTIYIAKEFKHGTCHYNAVLEHERKHVALDRKTVNKYLNVMVKAVNNTLKKVGYVHGPYDVAQIPALERQIEGILNSVIEQFYDNMNRENDALQKTTVDTLAEYQRVDALCKDKDKTQGRAAAFQATRKK